VHDFDGVFVNAEVETVGASVEVGIELGWRGEGDANERFWFQMADGELIEANP
jgi:hypothetical protein